MFLNIAYFASAGLCITLSVSIIIAQKILKLEYFIFLCGVYFTFLGVISFLFAVLFAYPAVQTYREILLMIRIIGLSCAYPVLLLVRHMNPSLLGKNKVKTILSVIILLQTIALIDLFGRLNLLFSVNGDVVTLNALFKLAYIPFSLFGLTALATLVYLTYRSMTGKYKKLMKTFSYGMFCMLPFEYWDLITGLVNVHFNNENLYIYNFGVLVFAAFFSVLVIQFIQSKLRMDALPMFEAGEASDSKADREYLEQIYQKTVMKITADKLFADENISMDSLAKRLNESRNEISKAVNMYYQDNFSNFINFFRVEELKKQLAVPEQSLSILELGLQAGFKSKTSINRIFYKFTKMSPREFRNSVLRNKPGDLTGKIILAEMPKQSQ